MKTNWRVLLLSLVAILLLSVSFLAGGVTGWALRGEPTNVVVPAEPEEQIVYLPPEDMPQDLQEQFEVFWEVWSLLENHFYDPSRVDQETMVYGAIQGMVDSLDDRYTLFSTPAQTDVARTHLQGEYEGIGAYIDHREGFPVILGPVHDDTPAARAGLREGDIVLEVDGVDVEGMPLEEVIARIKGPAGTEVTLTIYRPDEEDQFEVTLTRAHIEVLSVRLDLREDDIAVIELTAFGENTSNELDAALGNALEAEAKGIILDLRGNGGGYLVVAQEVLGRFLPEGVAVYETHRDGSLEPHPIVRGRVQAYDIPLVVLVNGGSASASEIVAGALQDYDRATLIGEQTFGKGSIQLVFDLPDQSSVRITIAQWLTPDERQIQDVGLAPDFIVPLTPEDYDAGRDPQLDAAVNYLLGDPLPDTATTPTPAPAP